MGDSEIPSKSFNRLQNLTDSSAYDEIVAGNTRKVSQTEAPAEELTDPRKDEGIDISYVGSNIPSRSFKYLQQSIGESDNKAGEQNATEAPSTMRQLSTGSMGGSDMESTQGAP